MVGLRILIQGPAVGIAKCGQKYTKLPDGLKIDGIREKRNFVLFQPIMKTVKIMLIFLNCKLRE